MNLYKRLIRPFLFLMNPEQAHHFVFRFLKLTFKIPGIAVLVRLICSRKSDLLRRELFGIPFPNPVGLAAGFDKDARLFNELSCFGFGFVEIGTVTPRPQPGNPSQRMFRLLSDEALINRMGFNNDGVEAMVERLKASKHKVIIGGNIGKNKDTENENAIEDYLHCFRALYNYVDYFAVNVSSPNTPGLRDLQDKEPLLKILTRIQELNDQLSFNKDKKHHKRKPLLLKISPDLGNNALDEIIEVCLEAQLDGIIATNTTVSRENLSSSADLIHQNGGLSGKPLRNKSTEIIRYLAKKSDGKLIIIGAGGIHSAEDAMDKLQAGASLLQLYTGFIYEGPGLIRRINKKVIAAAQQK